jgi:hypothetical protein
MPKVTPFFFFPYKNLLFFPYEEAVSTKQDYYYLNYDIENLANFSNF